MSWNLESSGTQAATVNTEHVLAQFTANGTFVLDVNLMNLLLGDAVELRVYDNIDGTNLRQIWKGSFQHAQISNIKESPPIPVMTGAKFTLKQIAGTSRVFPWELRRIVAAPDNTWDPNRSSANAILSNNNLTVTHGASAAWTTGFARFSTLSGNRYWEAKWTTIESSWRASNRLGFDNGFESTSTTLSASANSLAVDVDGNVYKTGETIFATAPGCAANAGDIVAFAVNFGRQLLWFRNVTTNSNWNDSVSADPATGIGGISFSWINPGPFFAGYTLAFNASPTASITVNFGATAFVGMVPAGFWHW